MKKTKGTHGYRCLSLAKEKNAPRTNYGGKTIMHLEGSIQILLSAHSLSYVAKEIKGRNSRKDKILITE